MKVLIDANVAIDFLGKRQDFYENAKQIFALIANKTIQGYVTADSITNITYVLRKQIDIVNLKYLLLEFIKMVNIIDITENDLVASLYAEGNDIEDNLQMACAERKKIDYIITRDQKGFVTSKIKTISPNEFIRIDIPSDWRNG